MSKLYLVPTPIGNLGDITVRAINVLKEVDAILAEDTRKSLILLKHYEIGNKLIAYHKFNEHHYTEKIIQRLLDGETFALITDAGTPSISDPGFMLVRDCIVNDIEIESLPGASSILPALTLSGFPSDRFVFEGFLPRKKGRQKRLKELENESRTMIFFESPHRLQKTLEEFKAIFGEERLCSVSRELTKIYEETRRGSIKELILYFSEKNIKGELVIIIKGK